MQIFIGGEGWDESAGGVIVYAGKGDTQEVIFLLIPIILSSLLVNPSSTIG